MYTHWIEKGETRLCLPTEETWLIHSSLCRHKAKLGEPSGSTWAQPDLCYWADFCSWTNLIDTYSCLDTIFILMLLSYKTAKLETNPSDAFTLRGYSTYNSLWLRESTQKEPVGRWSLSLNRLQCHMSVILNCNTFIQSVLSGHQASNGKWAFGSSHAEDLAAQPKALSFFPIYCPHFLKWHVPCHFAYLNSLIFHLTFKTIQQMLETFLYMYNIKCIYLFRLRKIIQSK